MASPQVISSDKRRDEAWRRGILHQWLLHDVQQQMVRGIFAYSGKKYVINSARRLGKSFAMCAMACEYAIKHPNSQIKYAAPTQRAVKKIIVPLMQQILDTCPKSLQPKFHTHDGVYRFPNGSEIHIAGASMDQADNLRGTSCDLAIIDEAAFIDSDQLEYLIESVLLPQTLHNRKAKIVIVSTPPRSPDHAFVRKYMQEAIAVDAYSRYSIYDNPLLVSEAIEEMKREAGGEHSTTWRREYLAEVVTDSESSVLPEAEHLPSQIYVLDLPPGFYPLTAVDLGYVDNTGVVFGYYDFRRVKLVIQAELLLSQRNSKDIVELILAKERELWGNRRPDRVVDGPSLVIADLNQTHGFSCRVPDKTELHEGVNRIRIDLNEQRFAIHPDCIQLIAQMQFATWDKQKKGFQRSAKGHYDLLAALVYWCKHVDRVRNPIHPAFGMDPYNTWNLPTNKIPEHHKALLKLFPVRRRL
jgi:hypothetical protein